MPAALGAQGTAADDAHAEGLVVDAADAPTWLGAGNGRFVYRRSVRGGSAFVLVDAATQERRAAFDHDRLAAAFVAALT